MSLDLDVRMTRIIHMNALKKEISKEAVRLLKVETTPEVTIKQVLSGQRVDLGDTALFEESQAYAVAFRGMESEVGLAFTYLDPTLPYVDEEESGFWMGVMVQGEREPVEFALAAIIARSAAKISGPASEIIDERKFWSSQRVNHYHDFVNDIEIGDRFDRVEQASEEFYSKLPKGDPIE
ncbi:hypothetical protein PAECIP111890_05683 [Paenibacillus sp. JJ-223]|nr:hypothetical protein PAECIP111890_05683 [Paenibacillus sp. JJ-223]